MDLEGIMLSEVSQTEKDKYCMLPLTCGILKNKNNKKKTKYTETENRLVVAWGRSRGVGKMGKSGQKVPTSNCKMYYPGNILYNMVTIVNSTERRIKIAEE